MGKDLGLISVLKVNGFIKRVDFLLITSYFCLGYHLIYYTMQSLNFLFWNVNRKPIIKEIANIAKHHNIDVLLLAECNFNLASFLLELNSETVEY